MVLLPEDDGTLGKIMVSTETGQELMEQAFISTTVTSRFLPPAPQTFVTPEWVYSQFSKPLAYLPTPAHEFDSPFPTKETKPTASRMMWRASKKRH